MKKLIISSIFAFSAIQSMAAIQNFTVCSKTQDIKSITVNFDDAVQNTVVRLSSTTSQVPPLVLGMQLGVLDKQQLEDDIGQIFIKAMPGINLLGSTILIRDEPDKSYVVVTEPDQKKSFYILQPNEQLETVTLEASYHESDCAAVIPAKVRKNKKTIVASKIITCDGGIVAVNPKITNQMISVMNSNKDEKTKNDKLKSILTLASEDQSQNSYCNQLISRIKFASQADADKKLRKCQKALKSDDAINGLSDQKLSVEESKAFGCSFSTFLNTMINFEF
jgi:hypothetical protein